MKKNIVCFDPIVLTALNWDHANATVALAAQKLTIEVKFYASCMPLSQDSRSGSFSAISNSWGSLHF